MFPGDTYSNWQICYNVSLPIYKYQRRSEFLFHSTYQRDIQDYIKEQNYIHKEKLIEST
jgi:hypothetical protein